MAAKARDLTNKKFGRLTALSPTEERRNSSIVWDCICDCGNHHKVTARVLFNSPYKMSCGCIQREKNAKHSKDITGQRFGKLTVVSRNLEHSKNKTDRISWWSHWNCRCDCGNESVVATGNLTSKHTKSCGCQKGEFMKEYVKTEEGKKQANIKDKLNYVEGTCIEFIQGKAINSNNTSGHKGVVWHKKAGKWTAVIMFKRKKYYLGLFADIEDAIEARKKAENKIYGEFLDWYNTEYKKTK
jgi:hypothetical protein